MIDIRRELEQVIARDTELISALNDMGVNPADAIQILRTRDIGCKSILERFGHLFDQVEKRLESFFFQAYGIPAATKFHVDEAYGNSINIRDENNNVGAICHLNQNIGFLSCSAGKLGGSEGLLPATLVGNRIVLPNNNVTTLQCD